MSRSPLPLLRCESRRRHPFERGLGKWSLAILLVAAALGDGLWLGPRDEAKRDAAKRERAQVLERSERERFVLVCSDGVCVSEPPRDHDHDIALTTTTTAR